MRALMLPVILSLALSCRSDEEGFARASVIERLDGGVGGPKALARPGDLLLENDRLRVAILGARNSMGPGLYGGSIVDADLQWNDARFPIGYGNDQMAEMFTTVNMNIIRPLETSDVFVVSDGSDGGAAVVRVEGAGEPFITLLKALFALVNGPDFGVVTDYIVEPGKPWVRMKTTATVHWDGVSELASDGQPLDYSDDGMPILEWGIESGIAIGDFFLQGGAVDVFAPDMGFDEDGEVYLAEQAGLNTITDPFQFDFVAGVGDGISYGLAPIEGDGFVPLFTSSQTAVFGAGSAGDGSSGRFPVGSTFTYERYLFVGHGDVGSIVDSYVEARQIPYGTISGHLTEEHTGTALSKVDVFAYRVVDGEVAERPWNQWRTDVDPRDDRPDGSFAGRLPVGDWEIVAHSPGRPDSERLRLSVEEGEELNVALAQPHGGTLKFTVRDEIGRAVPSKVSIFRHAGPVHRDPILGDGYIGGSPEMVVFPMYGVGEVELPPGTYYAVASRGLEYELDTSEVFTVDATRSANLDFLVSRSVDSEGWVSADFHVHAYPSHDSGVVLADRVRTMACEGVEFFTSNDHDFLTDYAPVIESLGMEEWIQSAIGNEVTTIEVGHFLGFPLGIDHLADAQGAVDWTDKNPGELLSAMRKAGQDAGYDPVVFIGHPRDGILGYFDQYGFNPYVGAIGAPQIDRPILSLTNPLLESSLISWDFDGLELLNGKRMDFIRTPTQPELDEYAATGDVSSYTMIERTLAEQADLEDGVYRLGYGQEGQVDDWFSLLNLGFRYTALGNSDTHGWMSTESGCPRNYVMSQTDDPSFVDDQEMADAVRKHQIVTSYGPFVQMWIDDQPIGSDVSINGAATLKIEVQAPTWVDVDRVEIYENGRLIHVWEVDETSDVYRLEEELEITPAQDSWYVAIVNGDRPLEPVFTPVEMPQIELQMVVTEALSGVDAVSSLLSPAIPIPRTYPVLPFALTNPIWVDVGGDGWVPPGLPSWLQEPIEPAE